MIDNMLSNGTRFHRTLLVLSTIGISVAASRVANDVREYGSWLVTAGGASLMIAADLGREVEDRASALASKAQTDLAKARADVLEASDGNGLRLWIGVGAALLLTSIPAYLWLG